MRLLLVSCVLFLAGCGSSSPAPKASSPEAKAVLAYIHENANDPKSLEIISISPVDKEGCVTVKMRSRNDKGVIVLTTNTYGTADGNIILLNWQDSQGNYHF